LRPPGPGARDAALRQRQAAREVWRRLHDGEDAVQVGERREALAIAEQLGQLAATGGGALRAVEVGDAEVDREARQAVRSLERGTVMAAVLALAEDCLGELPGLAVVLGRNAVRGDQSGLVGRREQRLDRFPVVVAARVVMCQERGVLEAALGRLGLAERPAPLAQRAARAQ